MAFEVFVVTVKFLSSFKKVQVLVILYPLVLAGCATISDGRDFAVYTDQGNSFAFVLGMDVLPGSGGTFLAGDLVAGQSASKIRRSPAIGHASMDDLVDCSDGNYKCIYTSWYTVFAVPDEGLSVRTHYIAQGAVFRLEKCLQQIGNRCIEAVISSDCQSKLDGGACAVVGGGREASKQPGRVGYFIYHESIGVTSFGSLRDPTSDLAEMEQVSREYKLRSSYGLLSSEWQKMFGLTTSMAH